MKEMEYGALDKRKAYFRNKREDRVVNRTLTNLIDYFTTEAVRETQWLQSQLMGEYINVLPKYRKKNKDTLRSLEKGYIARQLAFRELAEISLAELFRESSHERMFSMKEKDHQYILNVAQELEDNGRADANTELSVLRDTESITSRYQIEAPDENILDDLHRFAYVQYYQTMIKGIYLIERTSEFRVWEYKVIEKHIHDFYEDRK